ncbi:type IV pilus modification protein PilV [Rhodoferax fermentans]|uniref:Type IV pilus modification protein PilV n=1 Tax=Rhodoferax fermentans TaxID=28066 RepID=A0A1T1AW34_RHOFE|nr:type IV pilus modification protein PilV [Rhodoferax fermentans]MBK1682814.1 type IV pilus modification protein PilV [Rhodoferax fermentans]OOV08316.1 type IV pilus modification protein PilV [Rhodoferax fermentans]
MQHIPLHTQRGSSLIEILVALLVMSFGLLGMAALQARAIKGNQSSMQKTQAVIMSYYILDAMRVDQAQAKALAYNTGELDDDDLIGPICSAGAVAGTSLAANNLKAWITAVKAEIGNPDDTTTCGAVLCDAAGDCRVQVRWDDSRAGGLGVQMVDTNTRL